MSKVLRKTLKYLILYPLILLLLLVAMIYIPFIQNWLVNLVASYATEETGLTVKVEQVGLSFPLDLDVRGVVATDESGDTLLHVEQMVVDLDLSGIFSLNVGIDEITLRNGYVDSKSLLGEQLIKGRLGEFAITRPNFVDLSDCTASLNDIALHDCNLELRLAASTVPEDTTAAAPLDWNLSLHSISLNNVRLAATMPDSAFFATHISTFALEDITANLRSDSIAVGRMLACLDYVQADSLLVPSVSLVSNGVAKQAQNIVLQSLRLSALDSWVELTAVVDLDAFALDSTLGTFSLDGELSRTMMSFARDNLAVQLPDDLASHSLCFAFSVGGKASDLRLANSHIALDSLLRIDLNATAIDLFSDAMTLGLMAQLQSVAGNATLEAQYAADESYSLTLGDCRLSPQLISRDLPLQRLALQGNVSGRGLDVLGNAATMQARFTVGECATDSLRFDNLLLAADISDGNMHATFDGDNALAKFKAQLDASLGNTVDGTLSVDIACLDLNALHLTDSLLSLGACLHLDFASNLSDSHLVSGMVNDIQLIRPDAVLRPVNLSLDMLMRPDTLHCNFAAGEMLVDAALSGSLDGATTQLDRLLALVGSQIDQLHVDQDELRHNLPTATVDMRIKGRNPVSTAASLMGYNFDDFKLQLNSSPEQGLNGNGYLKALNLGALAFDDIRWAVWHDSTGVRATASIHNDKDNGAAIMLHSRTPNDSVDMPTGRELYKAHEKPVFDVAVDAWLLSDGAGAKLTFDDGEGKRGVDLGAVATFRDDGMHFRLIPEKPVIAFRNFQLNPDNYISLFDNGGIKANINLLADDGTGLLVYSTDSDFDSDTDPDSQLSTLNSQLSTPPIDLTASFHHVNLRELGNTIPYLPQLGGFMYGDVHYIGQDSTVTVALDAQLRDFSFNDAKFGDIALMATYLPEADGTHALDGLMNIRQADCLMFSGMMGDDSGLQMDVDLMQFPAAVLNSFTGDDMSLSGSIDGGIHVGTGDGDMRFDGALTMNSLTVNYPAYNLNLRMADNTLRMDRNRLVFDAVKFYGAGDRPLSLNGDINLGDFSDIKVNLAMTGRNFQLINAKKTASSLVYGKMFCNVDTRIAGSLNDLRLGGSLTVLGNTDLTYILKDSPLTVEDRLSDMVTFVDFSQEEVPEEPEMPPMDINLNMKVKIDEGTRIHCLLSEDKSSYVDIEGGGELAMTYDPLNDVQLNGRYTINSGEMKYQLPIIPLKTFKFQSGSFIEFKGKLLNPTLNIMAAERMRASVAGDNGTSRTVAFDVGLQLSQTLENMGLQFNIDAPEDSEVQNELSMLDETTRGRLAVTMLVTGMYINDNGNRASGEGFSTENALNSLLQSEISSLASKALNSVDVSFGMDNTTMADGSTQTDYSFSFAKHFWNNRVSVVLGGKVSSGKDAVNDGTTIIDNVSIEYRLDKSATRYVRVFYDKAYESMIDGKLTEMGAGIVLRRHTTHLGDLFIFRRKK